MKFFIQPNRNFTEEVKHLLNTLAHNKRFAIEFTRSAGEADLTLGADEGNDFIISEGFFSQLNKGDTTRLVDEHLLVRNRKGEPDYISSAFYLINCIQESRANDLDEIGRFKYASSYQAKNQNCTDNLVQKYFDKICTHPRLEHLNKHKEKSSFFLSHDIDSIHGALLQDGFYLLKKGKPHKLFNLFLNAVMQRPDWLNMDKIMKIEDEYSFRSTFFWLVNKGRINSREVNADYSIASKKIQFVIDSIASSGWENGLHKSISGDSYKQEIEKAGFPIKANRNHYLKFLLPELYDQIEKSGLEVDASLGFAEQIGFRNSYGQPFHPFNLKERKPYSFVEVPLNVMDGTLHRYMGVPLEQTSEVIIDFFEKSKFDCVLSLLWHNTYFTDFKFGGYLKVYKEILGYLHEQKFECISSEEIIRKYKWNK